MRDKRSFGRGILSASMLVLFLAPAVIRSANASNGHRSSPQTNSATFIPYDDYQNPESAAVECTGFKGTVDQMIQACWNATPANGIADASGIPGPHSLAKTIHLSGHPGTLSLGATTYDFSALVGTISPCAFSVENDGITIQGRGWGVTNITTKAPGTSRAICTLGGNQTQNVTISGISFVGPGSVPSQAGPPGKEGYSEGIVVARGNNWLIQKNEFTQWPWQALEFAEEDDGWLKGTPTQVFTHNSTIHANYFHDNGGEGICLCSGQGPNSQLNPAYDTISGNVFYHNGLSGWDLSATSNNTVSGNVLYDNGWTGRQGDQCGGQIHGNSNTVVNNQFIQSYQAGLVMNGSDNVVEHNFLVGTLGTYCDSRGLNCKPCLNGVDCTRGYNGEGIELASWSPVTTAQNTIQNNVIVGNGVQGTGKFGFGLLLFGGGGWTFATAPTDGGTDGKALKGDTLQLACGVETVVTAVRSGKVSSVRNWGLAPVATSGCSIGAGQAAADLGPGNATGVTLNLQSMGEVNYANNFLNNSILGNHGLGIRDVATTNTNTIEYNKVLLNGLGQIDDESPNSTVDNNILDVQTLESGSYSVGVAGSAMVPHMSGVPSGAYPPSVFLHNGSNDNILCPVGPVFGYCVANGPTKPYTIGGFAATPGVNKVLILGDLAGQRVTVQFNDAGSAQSNRILAVSPYSELTYPPFSTLTFLYDNNIHRWILISSSAQPL